MPSSHAATFLLLCFVLSLHACNCRILLAKKIHHGQSLGPISVMESTGSQLQDSENVPAMTAKSKHPISLQKGRCRHGGTSHYENTGITKIEVNSEKIMLGQVRGHDNSNADYHLVTSKNIEGVITERSLLGKTPAAQEIDATDADNDVAEDAVVMDYAHPHRKPPIHNEEN